MEKTAPIAVSIVITCYNLGQYLHEAVRDIVNLPGCEIILVNDGSTDRVTQEAIRELITQNPTIILLDQANTGLGKARNNGIRLASGKIIIPLDADNKLRPEFPVKALELLYDPNIHVVYGDAQLFGNKNQLWKGKVFDISEMVLNNYIDACAAFRKTDWEAVGGYDQNMPVMGFEDWDLWLRMAVKGYGFHYEPAVLFDYRVRDNSMLSDAWSKRQVLLDYIFQKKELAHLAALRASLIENQQLRQEPSMRQLLAVIGKKIRKRIRK